MYINPAKSKNEDLKRTQDLREDIINFAKKGYVILQGDLNARTNTNRDFILPDKSDENTELGLPIRNSVDKVKMDNRGNEILEICKHLNLSIINGRKPGDMYGAYTSIQWNGNSLIDYVISSREIFESIPTMRVGQFIPWISDHCAVHFQISTFMEKQMKKTKKIHTSKQLEFFYWGNDSSEKFMEALRENENELDELNNLNITNTAKIISKFTEIIQNISQKAGLKRKGVKNRRNRNDPSWFDKECRAAKNNLRCQGNIVKRQPNCTDQKLKLFEQKRNFKKLIKDKKKRFKENIIQEMALNKKNSKQFWKLLDKLKEPKHDTDFVRSISEQNWKQYFESILIGEKQPQYPCDCTDRGPLDGKISLEELKEASYILKSGKSSGIDAISNEMLLCILEFKPNILLDMFNSVLLHSGKTPEWYISILVPIYKKGPKMDPSNYRGISLICCVNKLFVAILNKRLVGFIYENNIITDEQLGFVKGNRTSDAHLILHNLIQDYCHKNGKQIYSCLIDFKKAFDSIPRDILFDKIKGYGITGNFFNTLKHMYSNDSIKIKIGEQLSENIYPNQGVRQGCILSPTLFNIFLADLPKTLDTVACNPVNIGDNKNLTCIIWADDVIMLSESEEGLKNMIIKLTSYTEENSIEINTDKTKCMIFNKTGRLMRRNFIYKNKKLEIVREYKYLGFLLTPSGEISSGLNDLKDRGVKQ